ncbi:MAG: hypothetical protein V1743_01320 [Nanoarchaeota archaeon]
MVSNKTLALLIIGAVLFSVVGQFISIYTLSNLKLAKAPITAPTGLAASQVGLVNLTILSATDISIVNATVDFGIGVVNSSRGAICSFATLTSNATGTWGGNLNNCWVNGSWSPTMNNVVNPNQTSKIVVQNDGNVIETVTVTSVQRNWSNFIGNCSSEDHNWYQFTVNQNDSSSSCALSAITSAWTNLTGAAQNVCTSLSWQDANDSINVAFNVTICQSNSATGYRNDNLTFTSAVA